MFRQRPGGSGPVNITLFILIVSIIAVNSFRLFLIFIDVPGPTSRTTPEREIMTAPAPKQEAQFDYRFSNVYSQPFPILEADERKREAVKNAFLFAWTNYKEFAWGNDFLIPIKKSGRDVFSGGLSITDALDTMIIMGLDTEYELGKEWVKKNFKMSGHYSVFEIIIRHLGSFLACYQLKGDQIFLEKAKVIGDAILPLLQNATGYFKTYARFQTHDNGEVTAAPDGKVEALLSDLGSIQLEMYTLSAVSGDMKYAKKASKVHKALFKAFPNVGLYAERINTENGKPHTEVLGVDSMSDSFYEYLIKIWLMTNNTMPVMLEKYLKTADAVTSQLVTKSGNLTLLARLVRGKNVQKMTHLATFAAGMLAVGAVKQNKNAVDHLRIADELATSFAKLYEMYPTGLMPECISFQGNRITVCDGAYKLRPETIESLFVLYRFTGLQKYRDYAWEIFQAIEKSCKVANGYATVRNVNQWPPQHEDLMDSYFLAETLKYLYLIFSSSDVIPLSRYVFNTEAHPLKIWTSSQAKEMEKVLAF